MYKEYDFTKLQPYKSESYKIIDQVDQLKECSEMLSKETIIGVDLENTYEDSYNGYTSLI